FHTVGYFTDPGRSEEDFVREANAAGLTLSGIGRYCLGPIDRKGVVIGYGAANEADIRQGMDVLARLFATAV
ncbi:MAG: PLP-dependent aminotransferase family protein, partial [Hoeflea sp.]|nr:PLP-dependent aminotransferase family protein [Hoeflea sp.]